MSGAEAIQEPVRVEQTGDPPVWPHRLAILVALATLPLIFMGGAVTSTGAGLAVPDWPTSFGFWWLPWNIWKHEGVRLEHTHRLLGEVVGLCTIAFVAATFRFDRRPLARGLALGALGLVIVQGILGGLRVRLLEHGLAPVHGCVAQAFFAYMAGLVAFTSQGWALERREPSRAARGLERLAVLLAGVAYLQVLLGAWYRHTAGARLEPHAIGGIVLLGLAGALTAKLRRAHPDRAWPLAAGRVLNAVLGGQVLLGIVAFMVKRSGAPVELKVMLVSLHLILGAIVLGTAVTLWLRITRALRPAGPGELEGPSVAQREVARDLVGVRP